MPPGLINCPTFRHCFSPTIQLILKVIYADYLSIELEVIIKFFRLLISLIAMTMVASCSDMFVVENNFLLINKTSSYFPGELEITITGNSFEPASVVKIGDKECIVQTFVMSTQLKCVVPSYYPVGGIVDVHVTNPGGSTTTLHDAFTYLPFSNIVSIAGTGVSTSPWPDGTGDVAKINSPETIILMGQNLYFADYGAKIIRKIDLSGINFDMINPVDGIVTGVIGSSGVHGNADGAFVGQSSFSYVESIRLYDEDKFIIGDAAALRMANLTSETVSTLVTSPGAQTYVGGLGIVNDDVYFTGGDDDLIYRYNLTTPATTVVVGNGSSGNTDDAGTLAIIDNPYSLDIDYKQEYMYVSSYNKFNIKQIRMSDMNVTTVLGAYGAPGFNDGIGTLATFEGPNAISAGNFLLISDYHNCTIRLADKSDWSVTTLAGSAGDCSHLDGAIGTGRMTRPWALYYHPEWGIFFGVEGYMRLIK